jgi:hypothetical protein
MTEPSEEEMIEKAQYEVEETPLTEEGLRRVLMSYFVMIAVGVALGILVFKLL